VSSAPDRANKGDSGYWRFAVCSISKRLSVLSSNTAADKNAMWLIRSQDGAFRKLMLKGALPQAVIQAIGDSPKGYFEATVEGKDVTFRAPATAQNW